MCVCVCVCVCVWLYMRVCVGRPYVNIELLTDSVWAAGILLLSLPNKAVN